MQAHIVRHLGQAALEVERLLTKIEAVPGLRQPLETVEAMDGARSDALGHEADRAAGEHAEFEMMAIDLGFAKRVFNQLALVFEPERVRHLAFDVIDRFVERTDRSLAHRMDPS